MAFQAFHVNQMDLVNAISNEITKQNPELPFEPSLYNKIIEAANMVVAECGRERVYSRKGMTPAEWLASDDVGLSSSYMITVLTSIGHPSPNGDAPRDADDLGRCIRMVKACGLEDKVSLMLDMGQQWKRIAKNWEHLVKLYEQEQYSEIYAFLREGRDQ